VNFGFGIGMPLKKRASCILFNPQTHQILLITRKKATDGFIFPGGAIEENESPQEAAIRESEEEAGITPIASEMVLIGEFIDPVKKTTTTVFSTCHYRSSGSCECEGRTHFWCPILEAEKHIRWNETLVRVFEAARMHFLSVIHPR